MSRDLGRDVPDLEKLYARKLWADFSYPKLQAKQNKNPGILDFLSVGLRKRKGKKISGILCFSRSVACCWGLCVTPQVHYESKCKRHLKEFIFPFHYESENEKKSPDLHL